MASPLQSDGYRLSKESWLGAQDMQVEKRLGSRERLSATHLVPLATTHVAGRVSVDIQTHLVGQIERSIAVEALGHDDHRIEPEDLSGPHDGVERDEVVGDTQVDEIAPEIFRLVVCLARVVSTDQNGLDLPIEKESGRRLKTISIKQITAPVNML